MAFDFGGGITYAQQQNFLRRAWSDQLFAQLGYLDAATEMDFPNQIGQTFTYTRPKPFVPVTTPLDPSTVGSNLNNGMTPKYFDVEKYTMQLLTYADLTQTDIIAQKVLIASEYLQNAKNLATQARQSLDQLSRNNLLQAYTGGNTYVTTTLGAPATTVAVDNVVGFEKVFVQSVLTNVSPTNTLAVDINGTTYTLVGAARDVTNTSQVAIYGGWSGTLTFSANVSVANGTQFNRVLAANRTPVIRPSGKLTTTALVSGDYIVGNMLIDAVAQLRNNAAKPKEGLGSYLLIGAPEALTQLAKDPQVRELFRTREFSNELYGDLKINEAYNCAFVETQDAPIETITNSAGNLIRTTQVIVCANECLHRGNFNLDPYQQESQLRRIGDTIYHYEYVDKIAHITRAPIDALGRFVSQTWQWIGGWCVPTDSTITPAIIPTANNAYYKRAVVLEFALS